MTMRRILTAAGAAALLTLIAGCASEDDKKMPEAPVAAPVSTTGAGPQDAVVIDRATLGLFGALPAVVTADGQPAPEPLVSLGRMLYFDKRLSKNQDVSCNTCHGLDKYGVDGERTSPGHKGQRGERNSPTTYNAAGHVAQFWDGRAADVEAQAVGPMTNPVEMAMADGPAVEKVLQSIPGYAEAFAAAFPGEAQPITLANAGKAIGAFERGLLTPGRWDAYLRGDDTALTAAEKRGLKTFMDTGCQTCHLGPYMGGAMFQKLGLVNPWPHQEDGGKFKVTGAEADKMFFKVPSLRNITETGPYFHDGSVATLDEAVRLMAHHQLGRDLSAEDGRTIVAFLGALKGDLPSAYITEPALPPSGPKTPAADPN